MGIFRTIFKKAIPIPDITKFERFLFVSPHPDDIDVGCGATVSNLMRQGKEIEILVLTDGRFGDMVGKFNEDELVEIRQDEEKNACEKYGITNLVMMNFEDGGLYDEMECAKEIAKEVVRFKPDVILMPDFHTLSECHVDHLKAGRAATYSFNMAMNPHIMQHLGVNDFHTIKAVAYFYTDKPNRYLKITKEDFEKQFEALSCHKSQFTADELKNFKQLFKLRAIRFGLRSCHKYAESFRVLGSIHTHCIPEAREL